DFSMLAIVRDESQQVVQKLSQHYTFNGPNGNPSDQTKKPNVLFYREAQLQPGKYQVQVIAYDAASREVNVSSTPLEIANIDETKPRLSSVAVLKTAERLTPEEQKRNQPFQFGELLLYPNLGEKI